ncbi:glycosyltransferase involved in cell wall biosynthesis [Mycetocola sp. CAN_C7]|uniref:glycosyltransferase n=1 Tax=Mycetocola sp. CAN_C7 TaxID=2787724 RepID=UPI0018CB0FD9
MKTAEPGTVAILAPSLSGGGAEHVASLWASALQARGYRVRVLLTNPSEADLATTHLEVVDVSSRLRSFVGAVPMVRRAVRATPVDAVLSVMPYWNLIALIVAASLPTRVRPSVTISDHTLHVPQRATASRSTKFQLALAKLLYRRAGSWIAVSHPVAAEMAALYGLDSSRLWVVVNPVADSSGTRRPPPASAETDPTLRLVFAGRLSPEKRPLTAVQVAATLARDHSIPVALDVFGVGPLEDEMRTLAGSLGVPITFHGWADRWFDRVTRHSVLLMPSKVEGFGNVLVEAAAASIPAVVSSRALGVADACIPGITAVLASTDSVPAYALAVLEARSLPFAVIDEWLRRFSSETGGDLVAEAVSRAASR